MMIIKYTFKKFLFFFCNSFESEEKTFHYLILTSNYDLLLYTAYERDDENGTTSTPVPFLRTSLGNKVTRKSLESDKYYMKLLRRNIVPSTTNETIDSTFQYNLLQSFDNINNRSGCFAMVSRPLWFLSDKEIFYHTMKHPMPNGVLGKKHCGVLTGFTSVKYNNDDGTTHSG